MTGISIGDQAQQFASLRNGLSIKTELARLTENLSTGRVDDITKQLGGETELFSGIQHSLTQLDAYSAAASETKQYLAYVQTALSQVANTRNATAERLLLVNDSSTIAQVDEAAQSANSAFNTVVRALNTQVADRALLGGTDVEGPPLATGADMLADMQAAVGAATDAATIISVVDAWFDDAAGGFNTMGYLGDTGAPQERRVSEARSFQMTARADDTAIKDVMKGAAIAALANDLPGLSRETKIEMLSDAGAKLFVASSDLIALQARVGFTEAGVEQAIAETSAQETTLGLLQNNLVRADPFETASQLQAIQLQLETHFTVTARMSQLSLLRYL